MGTFLLCSTLFSPQFVAWLIPGAALALIGADWIVGIGVLLVALLTIAEYVEYTPLLALQLSAMLVLVLRNAVLAATVLLALWRLRAGVLSKRGALPTLRVAQT
ncbi:MAG: hypothetical protein JOZ46_07025 [Candidatus Dormibacteraeota bacterium]|nr:hypothetical protein [Candidatus Dormibacteraeota bacterium]